jgi:Ca-activated chloride channel homolog
MKQTRFRAPFQTVTSSAVVVLLCAACHHSAPEQSAAKSSDIAFARAARSEGNAPAPSSEPRVNASETLSPSDMPSGAAPPARAKGVMDAAEEREARVGVWAPASSGVAAGLSQATAAPAPIEARRRPASHSSRDMGGAAVPAAKRSAPLASASTPLDQEAYAASADTGFARVADSPLSTFSIDVDTASYSNVRRFLQQGQLPPAGAVRVEELINYFPYAYEDPKRSEPFSITSEVSDAPWNPKHRLLHVGLQGRRVETSMLPARNLVFLIDVSGSMASPNKLPLLERSLGALVETLNERDRVAIVVYAGASGMVLPPTSGDRKAEIFAALDRLEAGGSTNGGAGIELAYSIASDLARPGATTRVVLATDGDFNVGATSEDALARLISEKRQTGVFLSVLGFGMGIVKDSTLEQLADRGNGNYAYVDSLAEARKVLVAEGGATLVTLAQDVKLQLEFNPEHVGSYRLIGYENRRLEQRDFNDDQKDAGELGAGHGVTALYELIPPSAISGPPPVDASRYQSATRVVPGHGGELCTIKVRYKQPGASSSERLEHVVRDEHVALAATSPAFRFSAAVATFGMTLRGSPERGTSSHALARELARGAIGQDLDGYQREFVSLVETAASLAHSPIASRPLLMP